MDYERELLHEILKSVERLDDSIDEVKNTLSNYNALLAVQAEQLTTHIKRTALLEEEMKPVRKHVALVNSLILILGGLFALIGAIKGIVELCQFFF